MIIIIILFLIISFVGYYLLRSSIITNYDKDTKILFYNIQTRTSDLLSKLLYQYSLKKETILQRHAMVMDYLHTQSSDALHVNLAPLYKKINEQHPENPFNIYITNKKLVITNTTYAPDKGFDLTFAKSTFDENYKKHTAGICTPLFEKSSKQFFSYTDQYITTKTDPKSAVLQISYTYKDTNDKLKEIQKLIASYPHIKDAKAYIVVDTGFVNDIVLKDYQSYKPNLKEILARIKEGSEIDKHLVNKNLTINHIIQDNIHYQEIYLLVKSPILQNTDIVYSILFDESDLEHKLNQLNLIMFIITVLGIAAILLSSRLRVKEIKLSEQDKFVQSSMHEIKTPLSVIALNNELRQMEFGQDEYSAEIDSAIKSLRHSYDDMSYIANQNELSYPIEQFNINEIVKSRIEYFQSILNANDKKIIFEEKSHCKINISYVELVRLIDNNISNAIKYSAPQSTITIIFEADTLSFNSHGSVIYDTKRIFDKYFRENNVVGGHGLGLNIVSDIAKKYNIIITLTSDEKNGTTFSYKLRCHTNVIS